MNLPLENPRAFDEPLGVSSLFIHLLRFHAGLAVLPSYREPTRFVPKTSEPVPVCSKLRRSGTSKYIILTSVPIVRISAVESVYPDFTGISVS